MWGQRETDDSGQTTVSRLSVCSLREPRVDDSQSPWAQSKFACPLFEGFKPSFL